MSQLHSTPFMKSVGFDIFFVIGIPVLALITAAVVVIYPSYFSLILTVDLALLGYHHVISTYTRLVFDLKSAKEYWLLLIPLPIAVIISVYLIALNFGVAAIGTIYLHWQWYHYTRQSEGINKAYAIKSKSQQGGNALFNRFIFYLVPVAAFLMMSSRPNSVFLGMDVWKIPVSYEVASTLIIVASILWVCWLLIQVRALYENTLGILHFAYLIFHYVIYVIAYVVIEDMTVGWVAINIWHNSQYIAFVWLFNVNKFKNGIDTNKLAISWLSQERNWPVYLLVCLTITFIIYSVVDEAAGYFSNITTLSLIIIFYQTINFHHYIVDSQIWKLRSKKLQTTLISN